MYKNLLKYKILNNILKKEIKENTKSIIKGGNSNIYIHKNLKTLIKEQKYDINAQFELLFYQKYQRNFLPKFYGYTIEENNLFIKLEYFKEGDLLNYLLGVPRICNIKVKKKLFQKKIIMTKSLIEIYKFLNINKIIHSDIKPDNIVVKNSKLYLIDFASIHFIKNNNFLNLTRDIGTEKYIPEEIFKYDLITSKTDIWSFGILLYILETSEHPYVFNIYDNDTDKLYEEIEFNIEYKIKNDKLKHLLRNMLIKEHTRFNLEQVLNHDYFNF